MYRSTPIEKEKLILKNPKFKQFFNQPKLKENNNKAPCSFYSMSDLGERKTTPKTNETLTNVLLI